VDDVCWYLTYGLDKSSKHEPINERRYGNRTWYDAAVHKFPMFNENETKAIITYLEYKKELGEESSDKEAIEQALECYWFKKG